MTSRSHHQKKGPWLHRFTVFLLSGVLTLLLLWLLGFVLDDIENWGGPSYSAIEQLELDPEFAHRVQELERKRVRIEKDIEIQREDQEILRRSTENSRTTMNQLLDIYRLNLQKDVKPTPEAQSALTESERLFLQNQRKYEEANELITELNQQRRALDSEITTATEALKTHRKPVLEQFQRARSNHELKVASIKLALLVPVFLLSAIIVFKRKKSPYLPILWAALLASSWKVGTVMHEHFPSELFKYIVIGAGILIVLAALIRLIRFVSSPARDWVLKQIRESYQRHRCPVCTDPILRGPLRHARWTKKGPVPIQTTTESREDPQPYTCPSCGVALFEKCESCESTRHALLPYCDSCGAEKKLPLDSEKGSLDNGLSEAPPQSS